MKFFQIATQWLNAGPNKAFAQRFSGLDWESQPKLRTEPKLIGDFRTLAVLIVPTVPGRFFPIRPRSVHNMAEYSLAHTCLRVSEINKSARLRRNLVRPLFIRSGKAHPSVHICGYVLAGATQ